MKYSGSITSAVLSALLLSACTTNPHAGLKEVVLLLVPPEEFGEVGSATDFKFDDERSLSYVIRFRDGRETHGSIGFGGGRAIETASDGVIAALYNAGLKGITTPEAGVLCIQLPRDLVEFSVTGCSVSFLPNDHGWVTGRPDREPAIETNIVDSSTVPPALRN